MLSCTQKNQIFLAVHTRVTAGTTMAAAASTKLSLAFVLLSALVVIGEVGGSMAADCSTVRCIQGGYITCDNYPGKQLDRTGATASARPTTAGTACSTSSPAPPTTAAAATRDS